MDSTSGNGANVTHLTRHEYELRGGLTIPLGGGKAQGPGTGPSELSFDGAVSDLGQFGTLDAWGVALTWQAAPWLRVTARQRSEEVAVSPELQSLPATTLPNVPYFDPASGQTVEVTLITGGGGNLANERRRVRQVSFNATPWKAYNLQLSADFLITDIENQAGALPLPTPAIVAAFPDRFVRDGTGRLIQVDSRTVNFDRQHTAELRTAVGFSIPLSGPPAPVVGGPRTSGRRDAAGARGGRGMRTVMQANLAWSHVFSSTSTIRAALGPVDLLAGGAIGLFGGRPRDGIDGNLSLSRGGTGIRASFAWRGQSFLAAGTSSAPDLLRFQPYTRFDVRLFADASQVFGPSPFSRGLRLTVSIDNLTNNRQAVSNNAGITPLGYQTYFRDALGRTVTIELRKAF